MRTPIWRHRKIAVAVSVVIVVLLLVFAAWFVYTRQTATRVIAAVRASFPTFCSGYEITAVEVLPTSAYIPTGTTVAISPGRYWGIRCQPHTQIFYGYAAIIDIDTCTPLEQLVNTLTFAEEYRIFNYGQRMPVCP